MSFAVKYLIEQNALILTLFAKWNIMFLYRVYKQWDLPSASEEVYENPAELMNRTSKNGQ